MWLDAVFLLNVPRSALEYLHICGRVGRLGRPGQAFVIVDSNKEIERMQKMYGEVHVSGEGIDIST
jgi:superfamily II DNA/RNA helicase